MEQEEIQVILSTLSAEASEHTVALMDNQRTMTRLDFVFAKAKLAYEMKASMPILNDKGIINLRNARHPLIDKKKVVPTNIKFVL